ncbi:MAG: hypothetical protein ACI9FG_001704 [Crocinitomicaceae bacterium]|jgi:hypothetical protein
MNKILFLPLAVVGLALGSANAAISLLGGGTGSFATGATAVSYDYTALSSFDASGASKIVFTFSDETGAGDGAISGVTFGGAAMTLAVSGYNSNLQLAQVYYIDASSVGGGAFGTGDIVVTGPGSNDMGGSWLFLSGTADGVGSTNSALAQSVGLTTSVGGSFVVASHANNGASGLAGGDLTTALLNADVGSAGGGSGYATITTAGAGTYSFTGSTSRPVTVAAAFAPAAIPEPTTTALLGLGGLALILRRRR